MLRNQGCRTVPALVLGAMALLCGGAFAGQAVDSGEGGPGNRTVEGSPGALPAALAFDGDAAFQFSQAAVGRTLGEHTLVDRDGQAVRLSELRGKPLVVSMVYTSCHNICSTTTQNLARAVKAARSAVGNDAFNVVTIGFDVRHDTPERMRGFARQRGVAHERNWKFLSVAGEAGVRRLSDDLGFIFVESAKGYDHLIQATVIGADGKVYRQVYGMEFEPASLAEPMKELVFGQPVEGFSLSALVDRVRLFCTIYDPRTSTYRFNYGMVVGLAVASMMAVGVGYLLIRLWLETLRGGMAGKGS